MPAKGYSMLAVLAGLFFFHLFFIPLRDLFIPWRKPGAALSTIPFPAVPDPGLLLPPRISLPVVLSPSFLPSTPFRTFFFLQGSYNLSFLVRVSLRVSTKFGARRLRGRDDDLSLAASRECK